MDESAAAPSPRFTTDPDKPGWLLFQPSGLDRFGEMFNPMWVRIEGEGRLARCRIEPREMFANSRGNLHGGMLNALVDQVLFIGSAALGQRKRQAVTLDSAMQFLNPGSANEPIDAVVEVIHRTGKMIFIRGIIEQEERRILAFSGTLRELPVPIVE